jgi:uncharacterized protein with GYD domain
MPHYILLFNWRDQGIRNVKDTIKRLENYKTAVENVGGRPDILYCFIPIAM